MRDIEDRIRRDSQRTLFAALLKARSRFGGNRKAVIDADGRELTYTELVRAILALGHAITRFTERGEKVGIMLPTGLGCLIAFFALSAYGRIPAMLNFTAGPRNLKGACQAAEVKTVLTAHAFIEIARLEALAEDMSEVVKLVRLEDVREGLTARDKLTAAVGSYLPWLVAASPPPSAPGVILFTSGTEGDPKGVVLSHSNVLANIAQINAHIETEDWDIFFNPLPMFHCYGLTAGSLFPLISGRLSVLHPSPLQVRIIPKRIRETQATVLFATDTFLQQYARVSDDADLQSLRFAVCGAERVRDETRSMVKRRFDLDVLEGYGVTEAAPVLAANQPDDIRPGTVGKMFPAVEVRLEPVEGLEDAGRLFVRGPNIMRGYLSANRPGEILPLEDGWHDTGDVVEIDTDGYVTIRDRMKRFAKIGGELVSLTVVENCASATWQESMHAAIAVPDPRKGEQIILVTDCQDAIDSRLRSWSQSHGVSPLAVPKRVIHVEEIPVLGTGKVDYVSVSRMVAAILEEEERARAEAEAEEKAKAEAEAEKEAAEQKKPEAKQPKNTEPKSE